MPCADSSKHHASPPSPQNSDIAGNKTRPRRNWAGRRQPPLGRPHKVWEGLGSRFGHTTEQVSGLRKGYTENLQLKEYQAHSWRRVQDTRLGTCCLVYPFHDHNKVTLCCTYYCLCWASRGNNSHQGSAELRALLKCSIGLGFFAEILVLFKMDQAAGKKTNKAEEGTSPLRHKLNGIVWIAMIPLDPSPSLIHTTLHLLHGEWDKEAQHSFLAIFLIHCLVYSHCQNNFEVKKKWKLEVTGRLHVKSGELCLCC